MSKESEKFESHLEGTPSGGFVAEHDRRILSAKSTRPPGADRRLPGEHVLVGRDTKLFTNEPVSEDKLASVLENLPPEIQAELVQMVRNNPSIARVLVSNLPGAEAQIIKAVQVGKEIGAQAKGKTPVRVIYKRNKYGEPVLVLPKVAQVRLSTYFPGVHQDFLPIALGAHHNVAGHYGNEDELMHHDEHHELDEGHTTHAHHAEIVAHPAERTEGRNV